MTKFLTGLFLILSPFTSYFAVSGWLRLPVMLILFLLFAFSLKLLFNPKISRESLLRVNKEDILLLLLLLLIWLSFLFGFRRIKSFNHSLAYSFSFLLYFFFLKIVLRYKGIEFPFILRMLFYGALICCGIIVVDWALVNMAGIEMRYWFVRDDPRIVNMYYYSKPYFISVGGVAEEPGNMAFFLNIFCPLGLLYLKIKNRFFSFYLFLGLYGISLLFLASSASIINIIVALAVVLLFDGLRVRRFQMKRSLLVYIFISLPFLIYFIIRYSPYLVKQVMEFIEKFSLSEANMSVSIRSNVWKAALADWVESPFFGQGPGYGMFAHEVGYHSVYLTFLADTGIFAFLVFLAFISWIFMILLRINGFYRNFLLIPFTASLMHFAVIGDFYHAPFWILIIVIQLIYKHQLQFTPNYESFDRHARLQRV